MKEPSGESLLRTLIELYADQMGVKIQCEIEGGKRNEVMGENLNSVYRTRRNLSGK